MLPSQSSTCVSCFCLRFEKPSEHSLCPIKVDFLVISDVNIMK